MYICVSPIACTHSRMLVYVITYDNLVGACHFLHRTLFWEDIPSLHSLSLQAIEDYFRRLAVFVCACRHACMCVCMCVCVHVCVYVCVCVCVDLCACMRLRTCLHACMHVCVHVHMSAFHVACSHSHSKMPPDLLDDSDMMQLLSIAATRLEHMQVRWEGPVPFRCVFQRNITYTRTYLCTYILYKLYDCRCVSG